MALDHPDFSHVAVLRDECGPATNLVHRIVDLHRVKPAPEIRFQCS